MTFVVFRVTITLQNMNALKALFFYINFRTLKPIEFILCTSKMISRKHSFEAILKHQSSDIVQIHMVFLYS